MKSDQHKQQGMQKNSKKDYILIRRKGRRQKSKKKEKLLWHSPGEYCFEATASKNFIIQLKYYTKESIMGKQKTSSQSSNDDDYTPGCEGKRPYQFVSDTKKQKLIELAVYNQVKVNRASRKVRVNNSNAKIIIRKQKEKLLQAQNQRKQPKSFVKTEPQAIIQKIPEQPQPMIPLADQAQYIFNYYILSPLQFFPMTFR